MEKRIIKPFISFIICYFANCDGKEVPGGVAPLGHGEREGPAGDKLFAQQMTQDTVGGYGVERSGTEPPGDLFPAAANAITLEQNPFLPIFGTEIDYRRSQRFIPMKPKKPKRLRITERDYILANRKAAREEEILAHGKPISFRSHFHKIKKKYDRKQLKKVISDTTDDGFSF